MYLRVRPAISILSLLFSLCVIAPLGFHSCAFGQQSPQSAVPPSSFSILKSSAERGDSAAQYELAVAYLRSNPAVPDYSSAIRWLQSSAEQGNAHAQFVLGYLYEHGEGIDRDYAKAAES